MLALLPSPCVAGVREVSADHAASHVGKAEGVVTLLRATAYHRTKRNILLPMDIIERVSGHLGPEFLVLLATPPSTEERGLEARLWKPKKPSVINLRAQFSWLFVPCFFRWLILLFSPSLWSGSGSLQHGASQEDFLRGNVTQAVRDATFDLASLAHTHLQKVIPTIQRACISWLFSSSPFHRPDLWRTISHVLPSKHYCQL